MLKTSLWSINDDLFADISSKIKLKGEIKDKETMKSRIGMNIGNIYNDTLTIVLLFDDAEVLQTFLYM